MSKILILGTNGEIVQALVDNILLKSSAEMVIYDQVPKIQVTAPERQQLVLGSLTDQVALKEAMVGVNVVYLNRLLNENEVRAVVSAMKVARVKRLVVNSIVGYYGEVTGDFGIWNTKQLGMGAIARMRRCANAIERSGLDWTILRFTWTYNDDNNEDYCFVDKNEDFNLVQITSQAAGLALYKVICDQTNYFAKKNLGVGEPGMVGAKPDFYL